MFLQIKRGDKVVLAPRMTIIVLVIQRMSPHLRLVISFGDKFARQTGLVGVFFLVGGYDRDK